MGLKTKNFNIMGVQQCLREGGYKKKIYIYIGCISQKGGLAKKEWGGCFWGGGEGWYPDAHYDLARVHARTWDRTCWCELVELIKIFPAV